MGSMYRIRFHGRGGQGMKTASRILGTAFFLEGFEVQDAPRYGAERRGAPISAYVRASHLEIKERGIIRDPSLVIVADETLVPMPVAAVLQGLSAQTMLLIHSREKPQLWRDRLNVAGPIRTFSSTGESQARLAWRHSGTACAAAGARLVGVVSWESLAVALNRELAGLSAASLRENLDLARWAYDLMEPDQGRVVPARLLSAEAFPRPEWVDLQYEDARVAAPAIHAAMTSELVETGLWRTRRPVIDSDHCKGCWWLCSTYCPDGAIQVDESGRPQIDYAHCKGCMVCVVQCPNHAIDMIPERVEQNAAVAGKDS
jgi:pyruvate ferredoxin oxidoreductase gamma subunit